MTIIKRVKDVLVQHGEGALAEELDAHLLTLTTLVTRLGDLHKRKDEVVREFINCVQAQCEHETWAHSDLSEIACVKCGHVVNSDKAWVFGKRVLEKPYDFRYKHFYVGGVKFRLNHEMRKLLAEKLVVKRIEKKESNQHKEQGNV